MINKYFRKMFLAFCLSTVCLLSSLPTVAFTETPQKKAEKEVSEVEIVTGDNSFENYISSNSFETTNETIVLMAENTENLEISETEGKKAVVLDKSGEKAEFPFEVKRGGLFNLSAEFIPLAGAGNKIGISVFIDGKLPYDELGNIELPRLWTNAHEIKQNSLGNEYQPTQIEKRIWMNHRFYDTNGLYQEQFSVNLERGVHTITIVSSDEPFALASVTLKGAKKIPAYEDLKIDYSKNGLKNYTGEEITIEGEKADYKTEKSIALKSDSTNAYLSPVDPYVSKINYIGGDGWSKNGDTVYWEIDVPRTGLYKIGLRYLQSFTLNGYSYRRLTIDGEVPFKEAEALPFKYGDNWVYKYFGADDNTPYFFYLEEGKHTLALSVTMGPLSGVNRRLQNVVSKLGKDYRSIVKITGETPDVNRDYDLFGQISGLSESFEKLSEELKQLIEEMQNITGSRGGSDIVVLQNMRSTIIKMLEHPFQAQDYKDSFYSNYCSIGSVLYSMRNLSLAIDCIQIGNPETVFSEDKTSFSENIRFSVKRFFYSFVADYSSVSESDSKEALTIWLYWGRDQTQIFEKLVQESFITKFDIPVNIKIVNSSLIMAMLSDNAPDLSLKLGRTEPVNLALRGALYDLKQFDDFEEISKRFTETATVPYTFRGGCYALPDTQDFNVLFYRTDVLEEYGLTPPNTWEEFFNCVSVLSRNNMQIGLPVPSNDSAGLYTTLLLQNNGTLYTEDQKTTKLASAESIKAFELTTRMFIDYGLPVSFDFYNRFRSGEMPLGIASYAMCTQLAVTAPEISGKWAIAEIPGLETEDGINNLTATGGTGNVILKNTKSPENAWTFLKWWTSAEIQSEYSNEVEAVLGEVARSTSANKEALSLMPWKKEHLSVIMKQRENVIDLPEVPGGYYVNRSINMAFWNVYNKHEDVKDTVVSWGNIADREIERKLKDYNLFG